MVYIYIPKLNLIISKIPPPMTERARAASLDPADYAGADYVSPGPRPGRVQVDGLVVV